MGSEYERAQEKKREGKSKRGSVDNANRLAGLQGRGGTNGKADWGRARPEWIASVITAATLRGLAISFSLSRDGGAHGLFLLDGGDRAQLWFNQDADLDIELEKVYEYLSSLQ